MHGTDSTQPLQKEPAMTDIAAPSNLDTAALLEEYRSKVVPAAAAFVRDRMSARELREIWLPYFRGSFLAYERAVQEAWRGAYGPDHGTEPGPPMADPKYADQLRYFQSTLSPNNPARLISVL